MVKVLKETGSLAELGLALLQYQTGGMELKVEGGDDVWDEIV